MKTDCHIHIERGGYTLGWLQKFVDKAIEQGLDEIWLLEHCYRFKEFLPMYREIRGYSDYIRAWLDRKCAVLELEDYLKLLEAARRETYPVKIKFGLEVCYVKGFEDLVSEIKSNSNLDFFVGSAHFIDNFPFDHKPEHWEGINVDEAYKRFFETSVELAESGVFDGIAHPDNIKLFGHKPNFSLDLWYDKLAETLAKRNMYAEMNSGCRRRTGCELGMNKNLINALKNRGVRIITASDAHCPEDVGAYIDEMNKILI